MTRPIATEMIDLHTKAYPVDVRAIADALDLRVIEQRLADEISGKIERDWIDGDGFMITVNAAHPPVRRRFTLAHEIAHYVLHRDHIGDGIVDDGLYRSKTITDELERQANRYAAAILMPRQLVRRAWEDGHRTAQDLASAFKVSPAVAEIRMRELGCVLWR